MFAFSLQTPRVQCFNYSLLVSWYSWVRPVWRRTPLLYVTILATLCIKGLNRETCKTPAAALYSVVTVNRRLAYRQAEQQCSFD